MHSRERKETGKGGGGGRGFIAAVMEGGDAFGVYVILRDVGRRKIIQMRKLS